ncbi:MAG: hotdog fold domain-containing protein [Stagnimonas sp.]|nr:hotdog fold domain-containing protein [Stagnimonas sp.]
MSKPSAVLKLWNTLKSKPGGKWLFSQAISRKAPYFATVRPRFEAVESGRAELTAEKRRAVHNHIGTFHAIAICNMAEAAMGIVAEATLPATHRWLPKSMSVRYLKKAETDLRAVATIDPKTVYGPAGFDLPVKVDVLDTRGEIVFDAIINIWVTAKKKT